MPPRTHLNAEIDVIRRKDVNAAHADTFLSQDAPAPPPRYTGRRAELSLAERQQVAVLRAAGLSISAIARELRRPRKTISATLQHPDVEEMRAVSRAALVAALPDFARDFIRASKVAAERGRHEPALDALLHLRALEPVQRDTTPAVQVLIGVQALPGLPAPPAPVGTLPVDCPPKEAHGERNQP